MTALIAIPAQRTTGKEEDGYASCCRQAYIDSLIEVGATPIIIPLGLAETSWAKIYDKCEGILLSGGSDVNPSLYNESAHPKLGELIDERDRLESWLVKRAFQDDRPLLGICRGIQIINVALGGTLYQDLPDQFASEISHRSKGKGCWQNLAHALKIEADSKLSQILNTQQCLVNSLHHQAIKDLAKGLKVSAKSEDGLTEGVEGINKKFFVGIQGHPEALWQKTDNIWLNLFKEFVAAC